MENGGYKRLLQNGGFTAFLGTQFLGALNDSFYQSFVLLRAQAADPLYVPLSLALFNLPFLVFSGYAGHLCDAISKRKVMIGVKAFEIGITVLGLGALVSGRLEWMMAVMFLLGLHSTLFSPAKYGIVPEIWPDEELSHANGLLEMSTFVAMVLGMSLAGVMYGRSAGAAWRVGVVTIAFAAGGLLTSFRICRVPASGARQRFRSNPFAEIAGSTRHLIENRPLWLAVLGISFFWFFGALFKMDLPGFGRAVLHASDERTALLWTFLAIGVGTGNLLAGRLSGKKVELGLVPLGGVWLALGSFALFAARGSYAWSVAALVWIGIASGLFVVPLYAFVQQRAGKQEKGRIVAANNFYQTIAMLAASVLLYLCQKPLGEAGMVLLAGVLTLAATLCIISIVPAFFVRFVLWMFTHTVFRIRIYEQSGTGLAAGPGQAGRPVPQPALLVANHVSQVDGLLIGACIQRFVRFMVWKPYYEMAPLNWLFRLMHAIPVGSSGREAVEAIRAARRELEAGHIVCIFAEGAISRTGNLLPFKRGLEKIVAGLDVPIVPVYLDGMWGSIFSFERGRFFWKLPKRVPYPVAVSFGAPMPSTSPAHQVREAIQQLAAEAVERRKKAADRLDLRLIRNCRRHWSRFGMADSSGRKMSYGRILAGGLLMRRWLRRERAGEEYVGILLPPSTAAALANIGTTLAGRVAVNLNFTAGRAAMEAAVAQCGLRTIVTSRLFVAKAKIELLDGMVFVEDMLGDTGNLARLRALLWARLAPARWIVQRDWTPDSPAAVIFSSGSTGEPKGVMLSHYNLLANIEAIQQLFAVDERDRILGVLPFFHSFGYTITLWFPLMTGCGVVYHINPTDAKTIGELAARYRATLLLSTPTFLAAYTRKCTREQFSTLRYVLAGAEPLRPPVAAAFEEKFGIAPLEGYGATEMSPVIAVNTPNFENGGERQIGHKPGTVGHPLPGVAARVVHPDSGEPLPPGAEGMLLVRGANRMIGYLGRPDLTERAVREGWYVTGDIAAIDDDGFIRITGRLARFSKIAGEMAPHGKIEEVLAKVLGDAPCAVTAVADGARGERLVAMYVKPGADPEELWSRLAQTDLPRLWLPKRENLYAVESLPLLGTGKLDLRALKAQAEQLVAAIA
jgi:acyl-[acyl-carrier-protein]-phospholipid O-acyltransferase/long-chain-fatty-acid--[acyl-carrier-protein] ligase